MHNILKGEIRIFCESRPPEEEDGSSVFVVGIQMKILGEEGIVSHWRWSHSK